MSSRSEHISVVGGAGRLQLRGSASIFALFVEGRAVAANWDVCDGSIGQCFYRISDCSLQQSAALAREAVFDALPADRPLADRFWPLLNQFVSGKYRLDYGVLAPERTIYAWDDCYYDHHQLFNYYNPGREILPTQNLDQLDKPRIQEWLRAIEAGRRPTVMTTMLDGSCAEIVLDGHHKLVAYSLAKIPPCRLAIVCVESSPIELGDWPGGMDGYPKEWSNRFSFMERLARNTR